jgi:hypothetical protein
MTVLAVVVAVLAGVPGLLLALLFLVAWPVRRHYTSMLRWQDRVPPDEVAKIHSEAARRNITPVVIVRDNWDEYGEPPRWPGGGLG